MVLYCWAVMNVRAVDRLLRVQTACRLQPLAGAVVHDRSRAHACIGRCHTCMIGTCVQEKYAQGMLEAPRRCMQRARGQAAKAKLAFVHVPHELSAVAPIRFRAYARVHVYHGIAHLRRSEHTTALNVRRELTVFVSRSDRVTVVNRSPPQETLSGLLGRCSLKESKARWKTDNGGLQLLTNRLLSRHVPVDCLR